MKKIEYTKATCRVEMDYYVKGSFLRGDIESGATEVRTHFTIESDASREVIGHVIKMAKQGCFAENMIQQAVPLKSTISLNGEPISVEGITEK